MTVVHPNHIVGINSITVQTGDSLSVHKADGSLIRTIVSNTGVSTFHAIEVSKGGGDLSVGISTLFADNSTGRIGIGTDIPDSNLHIWSHSNDTRIEIDSQGFKRNNYIGVTGADNLEIAADEDNLGGDSSIRFRIDADEKVRITSAGLVGIGTDSPNKILTVRGSSTPEILLKPIDATPAIFVGDTIRTGAGQHLAEYRGNWNGTAVGRMVVQAGADTSNKDDGRLLLFTATGGTMTEHFRIDENGKTTIGGGIQDQQASDFNSGANQLLITSNGATGLTIDSTSSTSSSIHFADGSTGSESYRGIIEYNHSNDYFSFGTSGSHRLKLEDGDLTLNGPEGISANLYLIADEGDDNGDGWRVGSNQDVNDLTLANNTSGSYVDKMRLSKEGYPTFPSLPAFSAKNSAGGDFTSGAQILYPNEDFDRNGDYTAASSYFTAPIAGIYFVSWSVKGTGSSNTTVYANCQVSTNDGVSWSQRGPALEFSSDISSEHTGMACVISLGADDRVRIGSATNARVDASDHFSICMLG